MSAILSIPLPNSDVVNCQSESWENAQPEIAKLCIRHWEEIALNKDLIPLNPDWKHYEELSNAGMLEVTTARTEKSLIGYQIYIVGPHLHYKSSITAISDVLYLAPEYRRGTTGIRLMKTAEKRLRERGVQRVVQNVKLHNDWGKILERMGYDPFECLYAKVLKD